MYLKNTYLLTNKWSLMDLGSSNPPYFVELLLGKILRYLSLYAVNLVFGIASLSALYTSYILLKELIHDSKVIKLALVLLCFSPTFLAFAFYDFKVENLLLTCSNLCLLFLLRCANQCRIKYCILGGFLGALAVLVKVSYLPFFAVFYVSFVFFSKKPKFINIPYFFLTLAFFLLPLVFWDYLYGLNIPYLLSGRTGILTTNSRPNYSDSFDINMDTRRQCNQEMVSHSYGHYYYGNILTQPFYYFFRINKDRVTADLSPYDKANPGIFLYIGFFLVPTLLFYKELTFNVPKKVWLYPAIALSCAFYLFIKGVYWYIFPIYPFMALAFALYFKRFLRLLPFRFLLISVFIYYLLYATLPYLPYIDPIPTVEQSKIKKTLDLKTKAFEDIKSGEYALFAFTREDNLVVPVTFVSNSDETIAYVPFYFASSNKHSYDDMAAELTNHHIRYVVAAFDNLPEERVFGPCLKADKENLYNFIKYKTEKTQSPVLYKIVN